MPQRSSPAPFEGVVEAPRDVIFSIHVIGNPGIDSKDKLHELVTIQNREMRCRLDGHPHDARCFFTLIGPSL